MCESKNISTLDKEFMKLERALASVMHHHHHMMGQRRLLRLIAEKKVVSQKELVETIGVRPQSIGESLTKLEHHGWITRRQDENDKRAVIVEITDKGSQKAEEHKGCGHHGHGQLNQALFQDFSDEEKDVLAGFIKRINDNLENHVKNKHGYPQHDGEHHEGKGCGHHGHGHGCCGHHKHHEA